MRGGIRLSLPVLGIVLLVLVDIGLVYLAFQHVRGDDDSAQVGQSLPEPSTTTTEPSTEEPTTEPTDDPTDQPAAVSFDEGQVLLDTAAGGTVVRATRGDCSDPESRAAVEVSKDGGASFDSAGIGLLRDVVRVVASSPVDLAVVGADDRCRLSAYVSTDGGETWAESQQSGEFWRLSPESPDAVRSPVRRTEPGCEVLGLSSFTEISARVLCTDGELRGTADAGASWAGLGDLDGGVSVYYEGPGDAWAVAVTDDCPAAVYSTTDGGADWEEQSCLEDGDGQAIAVANGVITVHLGGQVTTSDDDGASWTSP